MTAFEDIFADAISQLDRVVEGNPSEQTHLQRCLDLAGVVDWEQSNAGNELGEMLGPKGVRLFDTITQRIRSILSDEKSKELRDYKKFLYYLMLVHDLGKYDSRTQDYNGSAHEARSAEIVATYHTALQQELNWTKENADLLVHLTRFHGHLGIARLGEFSIVFLAPILDVLLAMSSDRKRLFLDLLIVLTCCDAGASGNFKTKTYYLDESRITLYDQLSQELFEISANIEPKHRDDAAKALLAQATEISNTVLRIRRMVTSENQLTVEDEAIEAALRRVVSRGQLDTKNFALTQFDHGTYVFAPLLARLSQGMKDVSRDSLDKFMTFLGVLCANLPQGGVYQFRESFSMKGDLQPYNSKRFNELFMAVEQGNTQEIETVLDRYQGRPTERADSNRL